MRSRDWSRLRPELDEETPGEHFGHPAAVRATGKTVAQRLRKAGRGVAGNLGGIGAERRHGNTGQRQLARSRLRVAAADGDPRGLNFAAFNARAEAKRDNGVQ